MRNLRIDHRLLLIANGRLSCGWFSLNAGLDRHGKTGAVAAIASVLLVMLSGCAGLPRPVAVTQIKPADIIVTAEESASLLFSEIGTELTIEIARWHNAADAAVSLTFDDGTLDQYLFAAPALEEHGMRATFFLIPGLMDGGIWNDSGTERLLFGWDAARSLHRRGHEIGAHTMTHGDLSRADRERVFWELSESQQQLQARIPGARVSTFAWPYWRSSHEARTVAAEIFAASRAGAASAARFREHGLPEARPIDRSAVNALALLPTHDPASWTAVADDLTSVGGWGVLSLHGVTDGVLADHAVGWQPLSLHQLRTVLSFLNDERYWVAPFGEVMDYIVRRDATTLTILSPPSAGGENAGRASARFVVSRSPEIQVRPGGSVTVVISNHGTACAAVVLADEQPLAVRCREGQALFDIPDGVAVIDLFLPYR
ncbi:MAG: polysaccharide deacetylase family protein [Spirochaetaceae bacterium]|nr:MAG: polysaccharide deacetylase family protein [Spirochaetaceae bacterium]